MTSPSQQANRFKFRAWDKSKEKMMYMDQPEYRSQFSLYFSEANDHHDFGVGVSHFNGEIEKTDSWPPDQIILMQSTGLLDRNGKEIFEGDILRFDTGGNIGWEPNIKPLYRTFRVSWSEGNAGGGDYDDPVSIGFSFQEEPKLSEIIGNVYETPHLLPKP